MLSTLQLKNFRGFNDHEVDLSRRTLLVGANNAGKSTIVEALRLVSLIANRPGLSARDVPSWLGEAAGSPFGFAPSLSGMDFQLGPEIFHGLSGPPANVKASFVSGGAIDLYLGPDRAVFAVVRRPDGAPVRTGAQREAAGITRIGVQPQVAPIQRREDLRDDDYVLRAMDTSLAPLHFLNQVRVLTEYWENFKRGAESTWPKLQITRPEVVTDYDSDRGRTTTRVTMFVRDGPFTGELSTMGHGLQMWLQMMWFLARSQRAATIVLDEPDVYMHADLQRKLIRFVGGANRNRQLVVATHSVEMMAEVNPSEIVVVDATRARSRAAEELGEIQQVINDLGGVHTLQYARLWSAKRCLIVEGKDMAVLKPMHDRLFPKADALDVSPFIGVGGWGGWNYAIGIARFVKAADPDITVYCLFDSDYHWPDEIAERRASARTHSIELHIWSRKEIENYLLDPLLIHRVLSSRCSRPPSVDELRGEMDRIAEGLKRQVVKGFMDCYPETRPARSTTLEAAEVHVDEAWKSLDDKLARVPAKEFLAELSAWCKQSYDVSFGIGTLTGVIEVRDIPAEAGSFLRAVEDCASVTVLA